MRYNRVRRNAYAHNCQVDVQRLNGTGNRHRAPSAGSIRFAQFHLLEHDLLHAALLVGDVLYRVMECQELNALLLCMFHLFDAGRHFSLRAAIDNHSLLGTQAFGGTDGIHRRIAPANDCHPLSECDRRIGIGVSGIHQVYARQVFVRREDVDAVLARNVHEVRQSGARRHENTLEAVSLQIRHAEGLAHDTILHEMYAHLCEVLNLYIYYLIRQAELRNAIFQYAANLVQSFENCDVVSVLGHIARKREPGRTRTYDRYLDAILFSHYRDGDMPALPFVIGRKAFQITNRHGFVPHLQVDALRFALLFLRTDAATYGRQCAGLLQDAGRL